MYENAQERRLCCKNSQIENFILEKFIEIYILGNKQSQYSENYNPKLLHEQH
jgi:hypothetical protein